MARIVPLVLGSRKEVYDHLTDLELLDVVVRFSQIFGQFRYVEVREMQDDGTVKESFYEVVSASTSCDGVRGD